MLWLLSFVGTLVLSYLLVPPVMALSWRIGAVDVPCDWRRMHRERIPRAGGLAIVGAFFAVYTLVMPWSRSLLGTLLGGGLLLALGLLDDIFCLNAWSKLLAQVAAVLTALGVSGTVSLGLLPWAALWLVALCNAHNMIDGLDGLLSGCVAIEGAALTVFYVLAGRGSAAIPPLLLSAAALGFRSWNRYPARIFAGDCGSTTLGFLMGFCSLEAFMVGTAAVGIPWELHVAPFLIFAYPLTDLVTAVLRRILRGKNPFAADRGHLHHRISAVGLTHVQSAGVLLTVTAGTGAIGAFLADPSLLLSASLASFAAVGILLALRSYILDFA